MQAEIVQREKSVKAECVFYIDVIRHQKDDWIEFRIELRIELQPLHSFPVGLLNEIY